jgi:hypothetical protein
MAVMDLDAKPIDEELLDGCQDEDFLNRLRQIAAEIEHGKP